MTELLNQQNFNTSIAKGLTLVDFYATWCGPCRMIVPIIESLSKKLEGKVKIAKLDIDEAQDVASSLGITSIPTIILFKDGKEVARVVGVKDEDYLSALISKHL